VGRREPRPNNVQARPSGVVDLRFEENASGGHDTFRHLFIKRMSPILWEDNVTVAHHYSVRHSGQLQTKTFAEDNNHPPQLARRAMFAHLPREMLEDGTHTK